ncbi:hypothetical protein [Fluviicola sp.]|uniref:hypothetical protein n=1 Tax=Fluviicola sp. TaxID=1917219 RepID=UPI00262E9803|nr:hypothetical protein [Fluviicola sp.]
MKLSVTYLARFTFLFAILLQSGFYAKAQETKPTETTPTVKFKPFDGVFILGYVDNGVFLNFTGPNISYTNKGSKIILGMLPSLRYKEDRGTYKNSPITPNLGVGLTYCYKKFAIQVPLYYNAKTSTSNGKWNIGIGIGMRLK